MALLMAKCLLGFFGGGMIGCSVKPNWKYFCLAIAGLLICELTMVLK
jgi:hypothetical protein